MKELGIISLNNLSENTYITGIAETATKHDVICYRFIPSNINPISKKVNGKKYDSISKEWIDFEFEVPSVLYDRCFYGTDLHSKQCAAIVSWLKNQKDIEFLGSGLPNKMEIYNVLKNSSLHPYVPPTKFVLTPITVLDELHQYQKIVLKPINGSQGKGIYFIEMLSDEYRVKTFKNKYIYKVFKEKNRMKDWLDSLLLKNDYMVQPYLSLTNNLGEPFDVRVLMQKDSKGNWLERGRGTRVGHPDGILSNLSAGGRVDRFEDWIQTLSPSLRDVIRFEITDILSALPFVLEHAFMPLFELGIDIGIAKDGALWILDINSKPGRKVILEISPEKKDELFEAPILFGKWISTKKSTERMR